MILYFDNGDFTREICKVDNEKEAFKEINAFCKERNYKIPYIRKWKANVKDLNQECTIFDAGCHFQFFYLTD